MQIQDVESAFITIPLPRPRGLSGGPIRASTGALCRITAGHYRGIREARGSPPERIVTIVDQGLKPLLLGEHPFETEYLWRKMYDALLGPQAQFTPAWDRRSVLAAI